MLVRKVITVPKARLFDPTFTYTRSDLDTPDKFRERMENYKKKKKHAGVPEKE